MYFQLDMSSLELEIISVAAQQVGNEIEIIEVRGDHDKEHWLIKERNVGIPGA